MNTTATVETLTAEVRVLMVGNRQVTLSVYRQLDRVPPALIEPFGRVNDNRDGGGLVTGVFVVGRHSKTGQLVRSEFKFGFDDTRNAQLLPLIVLAGLR